MKYIWFVLFLVVACDSQSIYENYYDLPKSVWHADSVINFRFEVTENSLPHDIFYNIRYTPSYPYYNIYVEYQIVDADNKPLHDWKRQDINLMHPETGVPLGKGIGNFFDKEILAHKSQNFPNKGIYYFKIRQFMRLEQLPELSAVGIRIEKAQ